MNMPHLTLEYTRNLIDLDPAATLRRLNVTMLASGLFEEADIKSRAVALDHWQVGVAAERREQAFVHVKIALLAGRPPEVRRVLAEAVLAALHPCCGAPAGIALQCCVETREIDRASYAKESFIAE